MAGLMEHVAIYPIDTIKTHMQSSKELFGVNQTMKIIYENGGFSRFWRGVSAIALGAIPAHALYFSAYEFSKKKLNIDKIGIDFLSTAITGTVATLFHDLIITPYDVIKQRMQLTGSKKIMPCIRNLLKAEGFFSFYRSLPITLFINAPYAITTIVINENAKKIIQPKKRKRKFLSYFACAAFAGSMASILTIPLDNIKTKLQVQTTVSSCTGDRVKGSLGPEVPGPSPCNECNTVTPNIKYKDVISTAKIIYREHGFVKGFLRGMLARVLCNAPSCAISWGTYEMMKHNFLKRREKTFH